MRAASGGDAPSMRMRMLWAATFLVAGLALVWVLRPVFAVLAASAGLAYLLDPFAHQPRHGRVMHYADSR